MASKKKTKITLRNLFYALVVIGLIVYLYPHSSDSLYKYKVGRTWNYATLIAPFDIPIRPDSSKIVATRDSISRNFVPVLSHKPMMADSVITNLLAKWKRDTVQPQNPQWEKAVKSHTIAYIRSAYLKNIVDASYGRRISNGDLPAVKIREGKTINKVATDDFTDVDEAYAGLLKALDDPDARAWAEANNIHGYMMPNLVYDEATSEKLLNDEIIRNTGTQGVILQGNPIIQRGAVITPQDYTNLRTYEQLLKEQNTGESINTWLLLFGQIVYVAMLLAVLMTYLANSVPAVWARNSSMLFIFILICVFFCASVLGEKIVNYGIYIVPFAIAPILMIVFFDAPTALFTSLTLILLCAGTVTVPFEFIVLQLSATVVAVYSLKNLGQRSQLLRTSAFVALAYLLSYVAYELMTNGSFEDLSLRIITYLLMASIFSTVAYVIMVLVERVFGFVSPVTLIELSDTNMPLLRQLSQDCPGTFQHSMAVSTLATDAAIKIGANEQLVRAGALYHDIGKLTNPNFFTENQRGVNPHDALPPDRSAQIIIQHVTDGVARANKARLPEEIKDFIREHHGAGKAKYFYYTYCNTHPGEEVDPAPFTYPGPNPRSRETSLLMMADSVEAASRSLTDRSNKAIAELVNKIIDSQIQEGLHNDSSLSFHDVQIIKDAFIKRLSTIYHSRIKYPDGPKTENPDEANDEVVIDPTE